MRRKLKEEYNHTISRICRQRMYLNTHICICDNRRIEIENCKRIIEYNDIYVKVKTSTLTLQVWGQNIVISDYNMDGIIIEGKISSIEFL